MLQENGFVLKSQKGSHMKFEKDDKIVIVLQHFETSGAGKIAPLFS